MRTYFFGCKANRQLRPHDSVGHYLYRENTTHIYGSDREFVSPWGQYPDGILCPKNTSQQGVANLHHKDGWTALSFWDYTGDARGKSNSNFFFEGTHGFDAALTLARHFYPVLFQRFEMFGLIVQENAVDVQTSQPAQ